ncbi:ShlB/FhaC/HecB family hemolysin secretion/activation protein [Yersinia sp. 2540 StPb PI]|uniref:ShlB/FhaC/HecB family hemolysin secretion/activation protein n=1 Tax=Yersinia sp. 2540 StPb PI TaxID=3117406 RepID=UPI003FA46A3B
MNNRVWLLLLFGTGGIWQYSAWANTVPMLIDQNNPSRISRDIAKPQTTRTAPPAISVPAPNAKLTLETLIDVQHIQFIGGTRYDLKLLREPFNGYIGKKVPLKNLLVATQSITTLYQQDGYILSYAYLPSDNFINGTVKIGLVEGYIANTRIQSENVAIGRWLTKLSQRIMAEKPLTQDTFERYNILMSRTPDTKVIATAKNPDNIYGATLLDVKARHPRNWNVSTALDSRKGVYSGVLNATLSGFTPYAEQFGVATLLPLDSKNRDQYLGLNYQQYLGSNGLLLQTRGSYYKQVPKDYTDVLTLYPQDITLSTRSEQTQYTGGVVLSYPLQLTRKRQWTLSGGVDYLEKSYNLKTRARFNTVNNYLLDLEEQNQRMRYPAAELALAGYQEYTQSYWSTRASVRKGINGALASSSVPWGDLGFTRWKLTGDGAYLMDEKWRLSASAEGDWSDNDLPEAEHVTFGGLRFGRGYPDSDATGDYGYGGQVEMRYLHNREQGNWLKTVQPYVVLDTAHTWYNSAIFPAKKLASYAVGVTFGDNKHYSLSLEGARPIGDLPSDSTRRDWRFNATLTYNFAN